MRVVWSDAGVKHAHLDARAPEARIPQLLSVKGPLYFERPVLCTHTTGACSLVPSQCCSVVSQTHADGLTALGPTAGKPTVTVERLPSSRRRSAALSAGTSVSFSPCVGRVWNLQRTTLQPSRAVRLC